MYTNKSNTATAIDYAEQLMCAFNGIKDGTLIDDHRDGAETIKIAGIAVLKNGEPVALFDDADFCLNSVETVGGVSHLSPWSVAGVVYGRGKSIGDAIDEYNKSIEDSVASGCMRNNGWRILVYKLIDKEV